MSTKRSQSKVASQKASAKKSAATSRNPTVDMVEHLAKIVESHGLSELVVRTGDAKITMRRGDVASQTVIHHTQPAFAPPVPAPRAQEQAASAAANEEPELHTVTSPFVGTFYRSPNPDASPYVQIGDRVDKGQVLCIVEAMKLMNEIEADQAGVVAAVLVENGEPVEYGQALYKLAAS